MSQNLHPQIVEPDLAELFPLKCAPYEKYMLLDDSPSHPMSSFMEFDVSGTIDVERLQYALELVLPRHPLLTCTVSSLGRSAQWLIGSELPKLSIANVGERLIDDEKLDLTKACGLRLWLVKRKPDWHTIVIMCHHACADAMGMMTFFAEWLALYADDTARLPAINPRALKYRASLSSQASFGLLRRIKKISKVMGGEKPSLLRCSGESSNSPQPGCCEVVLNSGQFSLLRKVTKQLQLSINDYLAAVLFQTIHRWNHNDPATSARYRLVIPVNQRGKESLYSSAMNRIGYKLLTLDVNSSVSQDNLASNIKREMDSVRKNPRGITSFLKLLKWADRLNLMPMLLRKQSHFATIVFSNLGDFRKNFSGILDDDGVKLIAGDLKVENILTAPPRRKNTHATICVVSYRNQLHIMSRGDGRGLSYPDTESFLKRYKTDLLHTLTSSAPPEDSISKD